VPHLTALSLLRKQSVLYPLYHLWRTLYLSKFSAIIVASTLHAVRAETAACTLATDALDEAQQTYDASGLTTDKNARDAAQLQKDTKCATDDTKDTEQTACEVATAQLDVAQKALDALPDGTDATIFEGAVEAAKIQKNADCAVAPASASVRKSMVECVVGSSAVALFWAFL
jgi:hypothetical protein